ncbi:uncharacterized protein BT62DRAFT_934315 [Guyanagaster necrorhizus]|uniref:Uncharacterized protein n=1 Tax=Guyanagaster necrorhizus TaxID=856835 RepID=A0A9P8ARS0_9AGAR|nr:uncharacterized protein BT62DRAFT_934315 [Guyanagaster necrorhizus MCA 3950]KAG7444142.1 hypothetical protein BT62DRAFT_934315 [Guyanagaster necrorhizus MCA 3950]
MTTLSFQRSMVENWTWGINIVVRDGLIMEQAKTPFGSITGTRSERFNIQSWQANHNRQKYGCTLT